MSGQAQSHHVYRAYLINHQGHICNSHHLNCESDEQAIEEARRLGYGVEVWDAPEGLRSALPSAPQHYHCLRHLLQKTRAITEFR
jgi:hypothetical protein